MFRMNRIYRRKALFKIHFGKILLTFLFGEVALHLIIRIAFRISYYQQYLHSLERAIQEGINIQGYFAWSLMDNFE